MNMVDIDKSSGRLSLSVKMCFAAPSIAGAAMAIPIVVHMPRFYSDVVLVPLGYIAIAIALARAFDALTDPLMGWIADRFPTRWGRRKPWIALGVPFAAIFFWALFSPPQGLSSLQAIYWFGLSFAGYFLFQTIYIIPHGALGAEISLDYNERSSVFGIQAIFIAIGTLIAAALPGIMDSLGMKDEHLVFKVMAAGFSVLMVLLYLFLLIRVPERPEFAARESNPLVPGVRRALRNRPFRVLFLSGVVYAIPAAIPGILVPYFTYYVIQPENPAIWLTVFLFTYLGSGFLFMPMWMRVAYRLGKLKTYIITSGIGIVGGLLLFTVGSGDILLMTFLQFCVGVVSGTGYFLVPAMGADVIDYDELRTGKRREAQFGAFWSIIPKFVAIPGSSIPIAILSAVGYVPNQIQTAEVVLVLRLLYSVFPAAFFAVGLWIMTKYPISEAIHLKIREGIAAHARGESAPDPLTGEMLLPVGKRPVDEDTGWFLDYFSRGELRRMIRSGTDRAVWEVLRAAAIALALCITSTWMAINAITGVAEPTGPLAVFAVLFAGLSFTFFLFEILRFGSARQIVSTPVPKEVLAEHLSSGTS